MLHQAIIKLYKHLLTIHVLVFIFYFVWIILLVGYFYSLLPFADNMQNVEELENIKKSGILPYFFITVFFGPIFETLVFQAFVIYVTQSLFLKIGVKSLICPVLCSALVFALDHSYNISYMALGFVVGLIFASSYVIVKQRKESAVIVVIIIHTIVNLVPFSLYFLL